MAPEQAGPPGGRGPVPPQRHPLAGADAAARRLRGPVAVGRGRKARQGRSRGGGEGAPAPSQPHQPYLLGRPDIDWISVAGLRIPFGLLLDPLTLVMMLVVSGVGSLIHIYSLGYMAHDPERVRYFSYLNLFTFFMLLLVMGGNLPLLFVGWEGVGLCSYLLIGFWFKKKSASDAGNKAFIVNRIGDAGLILGTILAFHTFGTFNLVEITDAVISTRLK